MPCGLSTYRPNAKVSLVRYVTLYLFNGGDRTERSTHVIEVNFKNFSRVKIRKRFYGYFVA